MRFRTTAAFCFVFSVTSAASEPEVRGDWLGQVQAGLVAAEYEVREHQAPNRAHGLRTVFAPDGIRIGPRTGGGPRWSFGLTLAGVGRDGDIAPPEAATLHADGNRMLYRRGAVTEWYVNDARGLEQGFTLAARPAGAGALRVAMAVEGDLTGRRSGDGGAVDFYSAGEVRVLRYDALVAIDGDGQALPARLELDGATLSIVVDDGGATYPIVIDPLTTSPSWMAAGGQVGAEFGVSVATAGDVNADGYSDVLIGAPEFDAGQEGEGRALLFLGSALGLEVAPAWTDDGDQALASFGVSVATAGDVDGDGFSDVLVGARHFDGVFVDEGRAFAYLGQPSGLTQEPVWVASGGQEGARFGNSVAPAGDVDGDGYSDVVVGAPTFDEGEPDAGRVDVYAGSAAGLSAAPLLSATSGQFGAALGASVSTGGDVNGDGFADVVAGAPFFNTGPAEVGGAFVYSGAVTGSASAPVWLVGAQPGAWFGFSVSTAGDVDGDGYADLVVGSPRYTDGEVGEGGAFVYRGEAVGLTPTPSWSATSDQIDAELGYSVATAGDVNGDGYGDVIVGARLFDGQVLDEGRVEAYFGSSTGLSPVPSWSVGGVVPLARAGTSVATAGDVDGDGYSDVLIGAPFHDDGQTQGGVVTVHRGSAGGPATTEGWAADGEQVEAAFGFALASAGDVDGDGFDDVIVGAYLAEDGAPDEGRVFLFRGTSAGLDPAPIWTADGEQAAAWFGYAVAGAGDVNGDGFTDVIVGEPRFAGGGPDEGRALVYLGATTGLAGAAGWAASSGQTDARFGWAVAAAGDVDADGFGDVMVGAPGGGAGASFVYLGAGAGPAGSPVWSAAGLDMTSELGTAVASAGDVNRDGFSDLLVGAPGAFADGRAYVHHGGPSGPAPSPAWIGEPAATLGRYGAAVAAGDMNGDGYSDVFAGAPLLGEGRVFVYHGGPTGTGDAVAKGLGAGTSGGDFGASVGAAGDVNGDGIADLIVGAPFNTAPQLSDGHAYLYLGSAEEIATFSDWSVVSVSAGARYGNAVAGAGDVNGDGYADVLVGAPGLTDALSQEGRAFLYFGNEGPGVALSPRQRTLDDTAPIAKLGVSTVEGFRAAAVGRTPFGRGRVRLRAEVRSLGTTFDGPIGGTFVDTPWADTGIDGVELSALVNELTEGPFHWRARLVYDPVSFPFKPASRWVSDARDGWQEEDLRVKKGVARFVPGDRLLGEVDAFGETASASFQGLAGMTLKLTIPETPTESTFLVVIADANGQTEKAWTVTAGSKKKTKRKWTLLTDDEYTLRVIGVAGVADVEVLTGRKLPPKALADVDVRKGKKSTKTAVFVAKGLPGGTLDATFLPKKGFAGPMTLAFTTPSGVTIDVTAFQQATAGGGLLLDDVPLDQAGDYLIEIGGYGQKKKEAVKGVLAPVQPPPGTATVEML